MEAGLMIKDGSRTDDQGCDHDVASTRKASLESATALVKSESSISGRQQSFETVVGIIRLKYLKMCKRVPRPGH